MRNARIGNRMIARMVERKLLPSAVTLYRKCKKFFKKQDNLFKRRIVGATPCVRPECSVRVYKRAGTGACPYGAVLKNEDLFFWESLTTQLAKSLLEKEIALKS